MIALFIAAHSCGQEIKPDKRFAMDELAATMKPDQLMIYKTVDGIALRLHIFRPVHWTPSDKRAAFVVFHGGGWIKGAPWEYYPFARMAARSGRIGICVEYRLVDTAKRLSPPVNCIKDGRSSIRFIRTHATSLGIDPDKIIAAGISAGGQIALSTALLDEFNESQDDLSVSCKPNAVVLYSPVVDCSPQGFGNNICGEDWQKFSPLYQVRAGMPPCLIFHGTGDTITPYAGVLEFGKKTVALGNTCDLIITPNAQHTWFRHNISAFDEIMAQTFTFLKWHGFE